ncbi:MAG: lytic transglycosylase domain-containing protein [Eubacteriales bacterium]|nr:lytic transglycosylase domain-containing protein [Eubacteriales bacterium]
MLKKRLVQKPARNRRLRYFLVLGAVLVALLVTLPILGKRYYPYNHRQQIEQYAGQYGLDPLLVAAIIRSESSFRPGAVSRVGACGLMQLMPATARWMAEKNDITYSDELLFEPAYNIRLGCVYLAYLNGRFGSPAETLAAWNAGEGNVRRWLAEGRRMENGEDIPYAETRQFIKRVNDAYEKYRWLYQSH